MSNPHPKQSPHKDDCKCPACRKKTGRLKKELHLFIEPELENWLRNEAVSQKKTVTAIIERGIKKLQEEPRMKIKTLVDENRASTTLAHPGAEVGNFRDSALQIREIVGVPEGVAASEVVRLFEGTVVCEYHDDPLLVIPFEDLGIGKIIKAPGYGKR